MGSDLLGLVVEDLLLGQSLSQDLPLLSHSLPYLRERNKAVENEAGVRPALPNGSGWLALLGTACASGVGLPSDVLLDEMQESCRLHLKMWLWSVGLLALAYNKHVTFEDPTRLAGKKTCSKALGLGINTLVKFTFPHLCLDLHLSPVVFGPLMLGCL